MNGGSYRVAKIFFLLVLWCCFSAAIVVGHVIFAPLPAPVPDTVVESFWSDIPSARAVVLPARRTSESRSVARIIFVEATAYCACERCCGKDPSDPLYGVTATGVKAQAGRTIAADWNFLPRGTRVRIEGFGDTVFVVEDTFGSVRRPGRIDIFFSSHSAALEFGRRRGVRVEILD